MLPPPHYTLCAQPMLLPEGPDKGHLDYVTFIAMSEGITAEKMWRSNDCSLRERFGHLVRSELAMSTADLLRQGQTVDLPGTFTALQLCELGFRHLE
jgi:hypothetical protein